MNSIKETKKQKKEYSKPKIDVVKIDNNITTFMMSIPPDPGPSAMNTNSSIESNPFKITLS